MIFQILNIRGMVKDAREDPGRFAGGQAQEAIVGILILPTIVVILGLAFLFALAFTHFLGGPYFFFKIVFFIGLIGSSVLGFVIYKLITTLRRSAKRVVNKTIENIQNKETTPAPN